jgi:hypothetical protein
MSYYKLINALSDDDGAWDVGEVVNYSDFEMKSMNTVQWRGQPDHEIEMEIDDESGDRELDFNLSATGIHVVSEKFARLLTPQEAEWYPVTFTNVTPQQSYFALRINSFYDCVDETHSEYDYWTAAEARDVPARANVYKSLNRFHIDSARCGDARIFRLAKYFPTVIVTEELMQSIVHAGISGLSFESVGPGHPEHSDHLTELDQEHQ